MALENENYDSIIREHGGYFGVPHNPTSTHSGSYTPKSDEEVIRQEHGGGWGVPQDPMEVYGTNDQEVKEKFNIMIQASEIRNVDEMVSSFPDTSIAMVIERRFRNTANLLSDRYGLSPDVVQQLNQQIGLDLSIILSAVKQGKNLYTPTMDASIYMGQHEMCDVMGLLDAYANYIDAAHVNISLNGISNPVLDETGNSMDLQTAIEYIKQQAITNANAMGIEIEANTR